MYLVDTNVISELRRGAKADYGVRTFFERCARDDHPAYLSVITVSELRRGVELIRHRNDLAQAQLLERWLDEVITSYQRFILPVNTEIASLWATLRVPHCKNTFDKLIAATAIHHGLTVVTRNERDFRGQPVEVLNPFSV